MCSPSLTNRGAINNKNTKHKLNNIWLNNEYYETPIGCRYPCRGHWHCRVGSATWIWRRSEINNMIFVLLTSDVDLNVGLTSLSVFPSILDLVSFKHLWNSRWSICNLQSTLDRSPQQLWILLWSCHWRNNQRCVYGILDGHRPTWWMGRARNVHCRGILTV